MSELVSRLRQLQGELHRTTPIVSVAAVPADLNIPSDTNPAATATTTNVPGRSWAWLAFPAVGAASVAGVLALAGFWDSEEPIQVENMEAIAIPETPVTLPPDPPTIAPPAAVKVQCANVARFVGEWIFDTAVKESNREKYRNKFGQYGLKIVLDDANCSLTAKMRKTSPSASTAKPKSVKIQSELGQLEVQFIFNDITYDFTLRFVDNSIDGHYAAKDNESGHFSGGLRQAGRPRAKKSRLTPEPNRTPHATTRRETAMTKPASASIAAFVNEHADALNRYFRSSGVPYADAQDLVHGHARDLPRQGPRGDREAARLPPGHRANEAAAISHAPAQLRGVS